MHQQVVQAVDGVHVAEGVPQLGQGAPGQLEGRALVPPHPAPVQAPQPEAEHDGGGQQDGGDGGAPGGPGGGGGEGVVVGAEVAYAPGGRRRRCGESVHGTILRASSHYPLIRQTRAAR